MSGKPASIGKVGALAVGAKVYAVGSPQGLELSLSDGLVSQFRGDESSPLIQTTAPISPGSSGGGLFDDEGRLVGITTFYLKKGQNLNFAVPVAWIDQLRTQAHLVEALTAVEAEPRSPELSTPPESASPAAIAPAPEPDAGMASDAPEGAELVSFTDRARIYVYPASIRGGHSGFLQAWVVTTFNTPQYDARDGYNFQSRRELYLQDCKQGRTGTLQTTDFSGPSGSGEVLWQSSTEPYLVQYKYVAPHTVGEAIFDYVCSRKK